MAYRLMDRGSPCLVAFADISSLPPVMHEKTRRLTIDVYHVGSQGRTQHSRILCSAAALFHPLEGAAHCMNLKSSWFIAVCAIFAISRLSGVD